MNSMYVVLFNTQKLSHGLLLIEDCSRKLMKSFFDIFEAFFIYFKHFSLKFFVEFFNLRFL